MVVALNATPSFDGKPFRFTRQFRLKSPLAIRQAMQDGQSVRKRYHGFRVVCAAAALGSVSRIPQFAFVVSRDAGPAVTRNRIKRRLREAVRIQRDSWPTAPSRVIFRVNESTVATAPFLDLLAEVDSALQFSKRSVIARPSQKQVNDDQA
jgi:ribonuclease P protein component